MKKVPKLRLKGFEGEWKETYLGKVSKDSSYGLGAEAIPFDGKNKYIRITDIDDESRLYKPKPVVSPSFFYPNYEVKENDMLFARTGASVGKTYLYNKTDGLLYYAGFLIKMNIFEGDAKFIFSQTLRRSYFNWIISESQRSGQPGINLQQLKTYSFLAPSYDEQQSIGNFFQTLDNLLAEQQNKLENLQKVKKSMLSKMFPKEGQKVPEIRFKGFDGDWEESLFENNFETSIKTNTLARVFLSVSEGEVLNIHYGDILIKFNSLLDLSKVDLPHIYNSKTFEYNNFLQNGDVIFADTAEDITAGKAIEIIDINNKKIVSGLHTIACHPRKSFGVGFWGYYLNSYSFHNHIIPLLQGIKVLSLNKSKLANLKVIIPKDAKEQHAIGDFFLNIDNLINNQQYKIESIQKIKQSFLSKMFV